MIEVRGLAKSFGDLRVVQDVSFLARDGEITGLIGPNGAGKTTMFRLICTVLRPGRGTTVIDGIDSREDPLAAARREFAEETGLQAPDGEPLDLGTLRQPSGKLVHAWALEGDLDVRDIHSNTFELEWPKGSGAMRSFPEVDRAAWFDLETASGKLVKGQVPFLHTLATRLQTLT